jgi:hypothetical protein
VQLQLSKPDLNTEAVQTNCYFLLDWGHKRLAWRARVGTNPLAAHSG